MNTRRFVTIPRFQGRPARVNAIISRGRNLFVVTDTSGSLIYRVDPNARVSLWFDVANAVRVATGREIDETNFVHGGLRSLAFHPNFRRNRLIYVSFMETRPTNPEDFEYLSDVAPDETNIPADSVVAEFRVRNGRPDPMSYRQVIRVGMPVYDHPVKQIAFRGRYLYIAHGDGSVQSDTARGGQRNDALGKILRIDPLRTRNRPYRIPRSNPFVNDPDWMSEIYALGFRNPHHMCFGQSGTLFVAETGRDNIEEVNVVVSGGNYGWSRREGTFVHELFGGIINGISDLPADDAQNGFIYPVIQVGHDGPIGAGFVGQAIAGGCPVENGSALDGLYFYSDFPMTGNLYYSTLRAISRARTTGNPSRLRQARTFQARIMFDHDDDPSTPNIPLENLRDVIRMEPGFETEDRADIRFGRGRRGELYWSSKRTGGIYLISNSLP